MRNKKKILPIIGFFLQSEIILKIMTLNHKIQSTETFSWSFFFNSQLKNKTD